MTRILSQRSCGVQSFSPVPMALQPVPVAAQAALSTGAVTSMLVCVAQAAKAKGPRQPKCSGQYPSCRADPMAQATVLGRLIGNADLV